MTSIRVHTLELERLKKDRANLLSRMKKATGYKLTELEEQFQKNHRRLQQAKSFLESLEIDK